MFVAGTKEGIDGRGGSIERFCRMEDNVCWNRLGERVLRTAAVRYLAMNSQRLRHSALVASASLLDWNLLKHVLFHAGCIMSHSCVVLSMEDRLQRRKTSVSPVACDVE
jgi:hypothetical protein